MTLQLVPVLDTPAAGPLRQSLKALVAGGQPLAIDGSTVERVGLACLQVLSAAQATAVAAGLPFRIEGASPALAEMATLAGLDLLAA